MPVLVATVTEKTVPVELKVIGNVEAYSTVSIKSRLAGQLVQVNFKEGQDVKQGDLLFVIDPVRMRRLSRQVGGQPGPGQGPGQQGPRRMPGATPELIKKQFVSQQEYDQAKATAESLAAVVKADEVAVQNAKLNLSYCYIKAPISGRTGNLIGQHGQRGAEADADTTMVGHQKTRSTPSVRLVCHPGTKPGGNQEVHGHGEGSGNRHHRRVGQQPGDGRPQLYRQHRGQHDGHHPAEGHLCQRVQDASGPDSS